MLAALHPEDYLNSVVGAASASAECQSVLDEISVPVYLTDADGFITHWNQACVQFAGREPQLGQDRWCVTWQIYTTDGNFLPHECCPMAKAIQERREIRGAVAIAMRPDGTRRAFKPYPTPLFNNRDELTGAVNVLIDVTDEQAGVLADQAERCRRLAGATYDRGTSSTLYTMADGFERTAQELRTQKDS